MISYILKALFKKQPEAKVEAEVTPPVAAYKVETPVLAVPTPVAPVEPPDAPVAEPVVETKKPATKKPRAKKTAK